MTTNIPEAEIVGPDTLEGYLEVGVPGAEPMKLPATVRNFLADQLTLEVPRSCGTAATSSLVGQGNSLGLTLAGSAESFQISGTVVWIRDPGDEDGPLTLGLKLERPRLATQRFLEKYLPSPVRDRQGFWVRWDEVKAKPPPSKSFLSPIQHYLAGLGLLLGGLTLQLNGGPVLKFFGLALLICACVELGSTVTRYLQSRKRSLP
jgi:hypothetical protein